MKIALLDDYQDVALTMAVWSRLPHGTHVESFVDHLSDESAVAERLKDFDVVVGMRERTPFRRSLLQRLPTLKLLITTGGRNASFDVAAAKEQGIVVCGTRSLGSPTAELAWGLILGLVRGLAVEDAAIRAGKWQTTVGPSLDGKTLGLVGVGNLGSQVAKVGLAFKMNVIAWSQNLTDERAAAAGAKRVEKDELFRESDVVSVHYVLSDRSRGMITAHELGLMKASAYFVNTSRGPLVVEKDLVALLDQGKIAGAALDVFDEEPLPLDHPIRRLPNTLLSPHIGYVTSDNYHQYYNDAVENVLAFLDGKPIRVLEPA